MHYTSGFIKNKPEDFKALTGSYSSLRDQLETQVNEIKKSNADHVGVVDEMLDPLAKSTSDTASSTDAPKEVPENDDDASNEPDQDDEPPSFSETFQEELSEKSEKALSVLKKSLRKNYIKSQAIQPTFDNMPNYKII